MELTGTMRGTGAKMKAEIGEDRVVFRGAFKGDVPFSEIGAEVRGTLLVLTFRGHTADFAAGGRAQQLGARIRKGGKA